MESDTVSVKSVKSIDSHHQVKELVVSDLSVCFKVHRTYSFVHAVLFHASGVLDLSAVSAVVEEQHVPWLSSSYEPTIIIRSTQHATRATYPR